MGFEEPKKFSIKKMNKIRSGVDALGEKRYIELAMNENQHREDMKNDPNKAADDYTTKELKIIEAEKQRKEAERGKIKAEKESLIDALTGLKNSRALKMEAIKILSDELRRSQDCTFIMMDIDDFKKINDNNGHPYGDKILKEVADAVKKALRGGDEVYRYGGEEFTVILRDIKVDEVNEAAERIRKNVAENVKATISIGYINSNQIPEYDKLRHRKENKFDISQRKFSSIKGKMIKLADSALYFSKKTGKNRATQFGEGMEIQEQKTAKV
jgi:diguanylate cyclase (GGDEF)-like protein